MKNLLLLTNYYPYFKGEEYLESEIQYLAEKFDRILLFPTLLSDEMTVTRSVPDNVTVIPITYDNSTKGKIISLITSFNLDKQAKFRVQRDAGLNPIYYMYDSYFEVRTKHAYLQISEYLSDQSIENGSEWIIYSYWMHATAKIAVDLKRIHFNNNVKYILTRAHRYDVDIQASPIKFLPEREYLLEHLDNVYCVSKNNQEYLKGAYPLYKDKVKVEHLGTKQVTDRPNATNKPFVIVSCSLMRKVKNIDKIVKALVELEKRGIRSVQWIHFGNGPEFENVKKLAHEQLKFISYSLPGYVSNHEVIEWYKENKPSLFLNVSSSEGIPVSIMESMSCGIPCIATNVGGNGEIVRNGINGLLIDAKTTKEELADNIEKILNLSESEYNILSKSAYEIWETEFWAHKNYSDFSTMLINKY